MAINVTPITMTQFKEILSWAKQQVEAGRLPREVSAEICETYGLNWMFVAPEVNAFKK